MSFSLRNKVAVVTGGAGHLGSAISRTLAEQGAHVIAVGRTPEKFAELAESDSWTQHGGVLEFRQLDLLDKPAVEACFREIAAAHGHLDVLVNNAYAARREKLDELNRQNFTEGFNQTFSIYFENAMSALPYLKATSGAVINNASLWGVLAHTPPMYLDLGNAPSLHTAVAKAGVIQMTKYLAVEWAPFGIRVNAFTPGWFPRKRGPERPDYMREITSRTPLGRIGQPAEIGGVVAFLASPAASFITGQNIIVDGGYSIW
jgi:gluconate 5-dehydrogenase